MAHNINLNIAQSPTPHFYLTPIRALPRNGRAIDFMKRVHKNKGHAKKDDIIMDVWMDGWMDVHFSN